MRSDNADLPSRHTLPKREYAMNIALKFERVLPILLMTLALSACTNLKDIKSYANESAKLTAYTDLTTRFRDTYEREQAYLPDGVVQQQAQDNDKKRKAAYNDLIQVHQQITLYLHTLAILAGEDTFDLSHNINAVGAGIKANPEFGVDAKLVDAINKITLGISKVATASYQKIAVKTLIKESDADLQTSLQGLLTLIHVYEKTNDNEKKTVLGFFEMEIPFAAKKDKLLTALARANAQARSSEYNRVQEKYAEAEKGIKSIAEGHKKLLENIDNLSKSEVRSQIRRITQDIKSVSEQLQIAAN